MHKKITVYDIAAEANVSVATVSRVLNNNEKVAEDTRKRVQEIIDNYDFKPNEVARSLYKNETKLIGFLVPDIRTPYFSSMVLEAENYALKHGYMIMICNTYGDSKTHAMYLRTLIERQAAGVICMGGVRNETSELIKLIKKYNESLPIVMINWFVNELNCYCVQSDETQGFKDVIAMLQKKGFKDVALLAGKRGVIPHENKVHLYKEAVNNGIFNDNEGYMVDGSLVWSSGTEGMLQLLSLPKPPEAVIACNDVLAVGAINACCRKHISVPKGISIVGFDNIPISKIVYPSLTTVTHDYRNLAKKAVDIIIDKTIQQKSERIFTYPMTLLNRESC